jgi:hypothetical protein
LCCGACNGINYVACAGDANNNVCGINNNVCAVAGVPCGPCCFVGAGR